MKQTSKTKIALVGNPNTGKTSLFNKLTGLTQKVGNYPGVTVEKKSGSFKWQGQQIELSDLPGTYSLIPDSQDEKVVLDLIKEELKNSSIDLFVYVAEVSNLRRNLLLFTQLRDLGLPMVLVINMADQLAAKQILIDKEQLEKELNVKVLLISVRNNLGISELKEQMVTGDPEFRSDINQNWKIQVLDLPSDEEGTSDKLAEQALRTNTVKRLRYINEAIAHAVQYKGGKYDGLRKKLDQIFLHRISGLIVFFAIILLIFQAIYSWSTLPMDWIDQGFAHLSHWMKTILPEGTLSDLLSEGVIPGIGGVVIFIPQIAMLFFFIGLLEESGYMSRVVFMTDKVMRKFGLSGKSIIPLISGTACAIPAVMATRNIKNNKERLITILVTPFITCSARLPVYLMMIALVIPATKIMGVSTQALILFSLYLLGFLAALGAAWVLSKVLKVKGKETFVVEMPDYKLPSMRNVMIQVYSKTKSFVVDAGKIIVALSILLWFLASHGVGEQFNNAEEIVKSELPQGYTQDELDAKVSAHQLEHSFIGVAGRTIEPVIAPLGYDWKIGIAVLSSFAAREVFIGTLATIYNVGNEEFGSIQSKMKKEVRKNGKPVYNLPTGISILLFYVFAMQCMSTLAIVKSETNGWKWPLVQLFGMTFLAYFVSLIAYQLLK